MKGSDAKKTEIFTQDEVKQELIELMVINDAAETDELNKKAEEVQDPEEAADVMKQYEDIIRTKKKGTINIAFHQGKVFKSFKDKENFIKLITEFKVHKSTIIFKINIYKLCTNFPKLMKSSIGLGFLKHCYKDVNEICENAQEFS